MPHLLLLYFHNQQQYQDGFEQHTARATAAGFIMTALVSTACLWAGREWGWGSFWLGLGPLCVDFWAWTCTLALTTSPPLPRLPQFNLLLIIVVGAGDDAEGCGNSAGKLPAAPTQQGAAYRA